ncbi:pyrroline-5-carboxylate reductase [Cohaesibacter sp. ES.047]|uniref:pyrroline-5-carboxylate reductase n=1 Tax=Cohaesibacter sp. ES.047 TaxID=1798205 RepID=UPI000BB82049|nr:pyrroline-5-carboxylate reductase [Cohaesibacter sp. ES.047]SNY91503.1 pyrroline-5-carboxylate reductase [Cohaesibacter sp. ES.047]
MELGNLSLVLVGAGKMGSAMLAGWLDMGLDAAKVTVIDPGQSDALQAFAKEKGFSLVASPEGVAAPQVMVVAVKPQMIDTVLPTLASVVDANTVVVSVAAGKKAVDFRKHLGQGTLIVRAMPNTPAQVGRGMTAAHADEQISSDMRDVVATLLSSMGRFVWVPSEDLIDSVTAISGSGPAYVFHLVEAMAKAGETLGLDPETAAILARQTIVGAGELLHQSELSAETLRQNVTSPGGTTAAALSVLMAEEGGLSDLVEEAARAARDRSIELSA